MPVLFLETLPLPTLKTYSNISIALFLGTLFYAYQTATNQAQGIPESVKQFTLSGDPTLVGNETETAPHVVVEDGVGDALDLSVYELIVGMTIVLTEETWCVWVLVNTAYCLLILVGKVIQHLIFGELRVAEAQHLKDRFWNFVFYKFIFIFGVLNVQHLGEVLSWGAWFSVLGFLHHLSQLSKDRFEYLSFSPTTPKWTHVQVLSLLLAIFFISCGLMGICVKVGWHHDLNTFGFMGAECAILLLKTMYVIARYSIYLWDINQEGTWERRGTFVYYAELTFELTALCFDFLHHLHMLIWSNIFLSMASLVICMQLRFLFHEIQRRCRRHKNYLRVVARMEARYPMASKEDLDRLRQDGGDDSCAICWDRMETARRLPCGHFFHNSCLRSWLEQDISCPTCRTSLQESSRGNEAASAATGEFDAAGAAPANGANGNAAAGDQAARPPPAPQRNHFFHFDGSRYVSWLPSFSVEVTHSLSLGGEPPRLPTSQVESMAREVQTVFPHMPVDVIVADLQITRSIDLTVDNVLEGRLLPPPRRLTPTPPESATSSASTFQTSASSSAEVAPSGDSEGGGGLLGPMELLDGYDDIGDEDDDYDDEDDEEEETVEDLIQIRRRLPARLTDPLRASASTPDFGTAVDDSHASPSLPLSLSESESLVEAASAATSPIEAVGGRFSKSSSERENMLRNRKALLMQQAKRRYLNRASKETEGTSESPEPSLPRSQPSPDLPPTAEH